MKVADLKSILQQANVSFTAKLTKPDLIKKIMETPAAAALAGDNGNAEDDEVSLSRLYKRRRSESSDVVSPICLPST